jgi:hypothetical protein
MDKKYSACVLTALLLTASFGVSSATLYLTYQIEASDFQDSNGDPPPPPTSNSVSGTITFAIDDTIAIAEQDNIVPDVLTGLDITDENGVTTDYDTSNTLVDATRFTNLDYGHTLIGATANTNDFLVGLSNDFRVQFNFHLTTYEATSVTENLSFVTTVDPLFVANVTNVTLLSVSPTLIPIGPALPLFLSGLGVIGMLGRRLETVS